MFTETSPIWAAVKPASTQNGFTMKPIAASPSLNTRMNSSTGAMPGRRSSSISAPKTGPRVRSSASASGSGGNGPAGPAFAAFDGGADVGARPDDPGVATVPLGGSPYRPTSHASVAAPAAIASATPQKPGARVDHPVTLSTSHRVPRPRPASAASAEGECSSAANSAPIPVDRTTTIRSRGAARHSAARPKKMTAATTNAPFQPSQSEAISTKPDASMPTR